VVERMNLLTGPGRLARMPSGMPTIIPRKSEAPPIPSVARSSARFFRMRLLEGRRFWPKKAPRQSVIFRPFSFRV
jgi:hypothetical protein